MLYFIGFFLIVLGFWRPSSKLISFMLLVYIWVLFAFNYDNADYHAYFSAYYGIGQGYFQNISVVEEGYIGLAFVCNRLLHLTYEQFIIFIATICTIVLSIVIKLYTSNVNVVYALFIIYPYWIMICQYRSYIATLCVLIGIYFLLNACTMRGELLFFVFIFLGALFHRSVILCCLFYFVKKFGSRTLFLVVPLFTAGVLSMRIPVVANYIGKFISPRKAQNWLLAQGNRSALGIVLLVLLRIVMTIMVYAIWRYFRQKEESQASHYQDCICKKGSLYLQEEYIFKINFLSLSFLALEVFERNYERLFRIAMILFFVVIAEFVRKRKFSVQNIPPIFVALISVYVIYTVYFFASLSGAHNTWIENAFIPVFEMNSLLQ